MNYDCSIKLNSPFVLCGYFSIIRTIIASVSIPESVVFSPFRNFFFFFQNDFKN